MKKILFMCVAIFLYSYSLFGQGGTKAELITPTVSFAAEALTKTVGEEAFTNVLTNDSDGAVNYTSGTPAVATVNASTGEVTIVAAGETTITATIAASATYAAATATYTLTVEAAAEPEPTTGTASFAASTLTKKVGEEPFTNALTTNSDGVQSFSSSATGVATVNGTTGEVTIVGEGTATIEVSIAESDKFTAVTASYTLKVETVANENDIKANKISIYPNPAIDMVVVRLASTYTLLARIELVSMQGKVLKSVIATDSETTLDLNGVASGVYIIRAKANAEAAPTAIRLIVK